MNRGIFAVMAIASAAMLTSCTVRINKSKLIDEINLEGDVTVVANEDYVTENVELDDFNKIAVKGSISVEFIYADETKAEIYGPSNLVRYVDLDVKDETVNVKYSKNVTISIGNRNLVVKLYAPSVEAFSIGGSGDITAELVNENALVMAVAGSGNIDIESIKVESLSATIAGSGDVTIAGGDLGEVKATIAGSGDVSLAGVAESVQASIAGSGDVIIRDLKCDNVSSKVSGSGDVVR